MLNVFAARLTVVIEVSACRVDTCIVLAAKDETVKELMKDVCAVMTVVCRDDVLMFPELTVVAVTEPVERDVNDRLPVVRIFAASERVASD